jgi:CheY-like chemotaxis protein
MKKLLSLLCLGLCASASVLSAEEDLELRGADLEKRTQALEEKLDDIGRAQAAVDPEKLTQELQWGKGWGFDFSEGQQHNSNILEAGLTSPRLNNLFSFGLRAGWLSSYSLFTHYPETFEDNGVLIRSADGNGVQVALRAIASTPLLFSFTRLYGGVEELFSYQYWDLHKDATDPVQGIMQYRMNTFLRALSRMLEDAGFQVSAYSSASVFRAELARAGASSPVPWNAALVDVTLPGDSGLEVIRELAGRAPGLPVAVVSGTASVADAMTALRAGAREFFEKPPRRAR